MFDTEQRSAIRCEVDAVGGIRRSGCSASESSVLASRTVMRLSVRSGVPTAPRPFGETSWPSGPLPVTTVFHVLSRDPDRRATCCRWRCSRSRARRPSFDSVIRCPGWPVLIARSMRPLGTSTMTSARACSEVTTTRYRPRQPRNPVRTLCSSRVSIVRTGRRRVGRSRTVSELPAPLCPP